MPKTQQIPKILVQVMSALFLATSLACTAPKARNQFLRRDDSAPLVDDRYSLTADRDKLAEYRSDLPEEKRRENDELAYLLQMFQEVKRSPSEIREKFDHAVRKKRELFDHDLQKEREKFTRDERSAREKFLIEQDGGREAFLRRKRERTEREDFFKDQDDRRRTFFANEHEKREDFESDLRERRKSFDDYIREKQTAFTQESRAYTVRYEESKKNSEPSPVRLAPSE